MWGLAQTPVWRPWEHDRAPEPTIAEAIAADGGPVVALLGADTPRGRYGLVGRPRVRPVERLDDALTGQGLRVAFLGYELGRAAVHLAPAAPPPGQPRGLVLELDDVVLTDHMTRTYAIVGAPAALPRPAPAPGPRPLGASLEPAISDTEHARRLRRVHEHIAAGDLYQANLTRRVDVHGEVSPFALLRHLAAVNPVAHAAYLRVGDFELLSNSMETLLTFDPATRLAASFPIKGTAPRSRAPEQLAASAKDRAEHVMIVDLVRNDLGRVATVGSVRVPELMRIEGYRGVWHGVSRVEAELAPHRSLVDLVTALFPGGSITGAPKRRAVQLLEALEGEPRGAYTGSLALLTPDGGCSMSILIRTLVRDARGWSIGVGGGIVADSDPTLEIEEMRDKLAVWREALRCSV